MYQLLELYNIKNDLPNELCEASNHLCKYLNFSSWKIIMFTKDKLYGFIHYSSDDHMNDEYMNIEHSGQERICFERAKEVSYINLMLDEEKIVIYTHMQDKSSKYKPLSKDASIELYIPLFSTVEFKKEICGCLYLAKNSMIDAKIKELKLDEYAMSHLISIERKFETDYLEYIGNKNLFNFIHIYSGIVKAREPLHTTHSYNVAFLSNLLGQELNFSQSQLYRIYMAAMLHDMGKVYIPESILNKNGPLTEIEKFEIKRHPIHSYNILKDLTYRFKSLSGIENIVLQHHERYDGKGYPNGLKGEEILLESRILAIADSVDAMLSERPYKKPMPINNVINELIINKGKKYDPHLAQLMINLLIE